MQGTNRESLEEKGTGSGLWWRLRRRIKGAMPEGRGDSRPFVSSSRAQPSISTALRESACMRQGKTMSWCCLTSGNERSAIEISRLRPSDDGAKRYQNSSALPNFMRRTFTPHS